MSVDCPPWREPGLRRLRHKCERIHRPQRGDVGRVQRCGQARAALLGRRRAEARLFQLGRGDHIGAFGDGLREQASSAGRRHQIHHAQAARGFARDGHVGRIAAESADVIANPSQRLNLIQQAIVAGDAKRRLAAQLGMRQPAEDTEPIVDRDHDNALAGEPCAVVHRLSARSRGKSAAVDPEEDRRRCEPRWEPRCSASGNPRSSAWVCPRRYSRAWVWAGSTPVQTRSLFLRLAIAASGWAVSSALSQPEAAHKECP